mmetsp:Transcript_32965/g.57883  ORF Transcript_32965/g.57883 Transcript_32965/m.57883 type:complete len:397 (-) Transcript_32965:2160-3350(-)
MEVKSREPLITKPKRSRSLLQRLCCCAEPEEDSPEESKVCGLNYSMMSTKSESLEVTRVIEFAAKRIYLIGKGKHRIFARFQHFDVRRNISNRTIDKPKDIEDNLWQERYLLFSKFDEGIKLDESAWSVTTHERIAKKIAQTCSANVVIDAFCGIGGNTIQFARKFKVIAIDIDCRKLDFAEHNSKIYNVFDNIEFVNGDFLVASENFRGDIVFLAPDMTFDPTGFDLFNHFNPPIRCIVKAALKCADHLLLYLPPNFDPEQLAQLVTECEDLEITADFSLFFYGTNLIAITCMMAKKSTLDFDPMASLLISRLKCTFEKAIMKKVISEIGLRKCIELLTEVENIISSSESLTGSRQNKIDVFLNLAKQRKLCEFDSISEELLEERDQVSCSPRFK